MSFCIIIGKSGAGEQRFPVSTRDLWKSVRILLTFWIPVYKMYIDYIPISHQGDLTMRTKRFAALATTFLLVVLALHVPAVAADQLSGTWKMNPAKSNYSPGPAPKSVTVKLDADENSIKMISVGTDAEGSPTNIEYSAKFDGKDYPITGVPNADTISVERIDASTFQTTAKKAGQVVMTVRSAISKDGKTRTSTFKGKDAQGRDVNNVVVYDKQ